VATGLAATATSLRQFIAWRLVQGLVTPGVFAGAIAYIHEEYPASYAGRATAAYVSGTVVGGFCGRLMVGLIAGVANWQEAFAALAIANLVAAIALAAGLPPERPRTVHSVSDGGLRALLELLRNRRLMATDVVGFCVLFSQVAAFTYVTFHLEAPPYGLGTAALGWLFVVYLVGAAVTPFAGRLVDAYGHRTGLTVGMTIGSVGAVFTLTPPLALIVLGLALVGTGVFIAQATASSYIGAVTTEHRGVAVGVYSSAYYVGGSLGGTLPSLVWTMGGWTACVLLVIVVQALTLGTALRFWRPGGHSRL
jgi:YNFM family putative membrane transporter